MIWPLLYSLTLPWASLRILLQALGSPQISRDPLKGRRGVTKNITKDWVEREGSPKDHRVSQSQRGGGGFAKKKYAKLKVLIVKIMTPRINSGDIAEILFVVVPS